MLRRPARLAMSLAMFVVCSSAPALSDLPSVRPVHTAYVDELPEVINRSAPVYPSLARDAGVQGTVLVQAHVDRDGRVIDTRIVKSIPMLDDAAIECVQQWRFKPALTNGKLADVWVAIPVQFSIDPRSPSPRHAPMQWPRTNRLSPPDGLGAGRYLIDADSSDLVIVSSIDGNHVRLGSPGQWTGSGVVTSRMYWGVFVYHDDAPDPRNRGARGTHFGTVDRSGRVRITGTFTNRDWPSFRSTWTPLDPRAVTIGRETLREVPAPGQPEHPIWPPERGETDGPDFEHPIWPPEWSKGDARVLLAEQISVDELPTLVHRVEPRRPEGDVPQEGSDPALVVVRARIGADGLVSDARIAQSVPSADAAALEAVRRWRFRPASRAGQPLSVSVYVPVRFGGR